MRPCLMLSLVRYLRSRWIEATFVTDALPGSRPQVAKDIQGPTLFFAIQQVFKGTLELRIVSLGPVAATLLRNWILWSGNVRPVGTATGSERGHFQTERARLCQLGYSPHKYLFVCILFWVLGGSRPPPVLRGRCSPCVGDSSCMLASVSRTP